jgi:hypothetical protein
MNAEPKQNHNGNSWKYIGIIITLVVLLLSSGVAWGMYTTKLDVYCKTLEENKVKVTALECRIGGIETQLSSMQTLLVEMNKKLDKMDKQ